MKTQVTRKTWDSSVT